MRLFCVKQKEENDCALACLATIARYYGKKISINNLAQYTTKINSELNIYELYNIADEIGFEATAYQCMEDFNEKDLKLPCVAFVYNSNGKGHYIVIRKISTINSFLSRTCLTTYSITIYISRFTTT